MDLVRVFEVFPDQEACIAYLERIRWDDDPCCPYCGGLKVARKKENRRIGRWNCYDCGSSFNVLQGTIFQKTRIPLQKWFVGLAIMVNAKKSVSSCQLARDLGMNQTTAWYMMHRLRAAMASEEHHLLRGIVEADETYVGGRPRRGKQYVEPTKRGRGTRKVPVLGAVERGGHVAAQVADNTTSFSIKKFLGRVVDTSDETTLITDEYRSYKAMDRVMNRLVIKHREWYVDGDVHTNTIEGFWSHLKRAWFGQHHHYSKHWMPMYVAEACWKYNRRRADTFEAFENFLAATVLPPDLRREWLGV